MCLYTGNKARQAAYTDVLHFKKEMALRRQNSPLQAAFCIGGGQNGRSGAMERYTGAASDCRWVQLLAEKEEKGFLKIR